MIAIKESYPSLQLMDQQCWLTDCHTSSVAPLQAVGIAAGGDWLLFCNCTEPKYILKLCYSYITQCSEHSWYFNIHFCILFNSLYVYMHAFPTFELL